MSLYHEAAAVLTAATQKDAGSIESIVFGKKDWQSPPKTLFALAVQTAKWSRILADVIDRSQILLTETQLSGALALALVHDVLVSKKGVALPPGHGLAKCINRHKTRLTAELTRVRIREGCSSMKLLQDQLENLSATQAGLNGTDQHPRWIRINRIKTTIDQELSTTFKAYTQVDSLSQVTDAAAKKQKLVYKDEHIPDLIAVPPGSSVTQYKAYEQGYIILQDKASCFPAYLLDHHPTHGVAMDTCAAPGNKTTHLAAIAFERRDQASAVSRLVIACEKDKLRSQTLTKMVDMAGARPLVEVRQGQNFLKLNPDTREFANVTALLLDPSCSGSGIVGRDEGGIHVWMPSTMSTTRTTKLAGGKRKRQPDLAEPTKAEHATQSEDQNTGDLESRLASLSEFQLRLLQHAMSFPAAQRITYSTCSVHAEENEDVVCQALCSDIARNRGWRVLLRGEQVSGMKAWHIRGDVAAVHAFDTQLTGSTSRQTVDEIASACIRCQKNGKDGTMGFFVAAFVRNPLQAGVADLHGPQPPAIGNGEQHNVHTEAEEWNGFDED